jgi:c-di-GMP-binding flagellar brake protein YcgR
MEFQVGQRLEIDFGELKCWTTLRGWVPGKVLFVDLPRGGRRRNLIREGMACRVKLVVPQAIQEFTSCVEEVVRGDPGVFHLRYPDGVREQRLRAELRVSTSFHVLFWTRNGGGRRARVVNLSPGGCLLEISGAFPEPGSGLIVTGVLPTHQLLLNVAGTVRRVQKPGSIGVGFDSLTPEQKRYVESAVRPGRRASGPEGEEEEAVRGEVGALKACPLEVLACVVAASGRGYEVDLWDEPRTGRLYFEEGQLVHARVGALAGLPAFQEAARWKRGQYCLTRARRIPHRNVSVGWEELGSWAGVRDFHSLEAEGVQTEVKR